MFFFICSFQRAPSEPLWFPGFDEGSGGGWPAVAATAPRQNPKFFYFCSISPSFSTLSSSKPKNPNRLTYCPRSTKRKENFYLFHVYESSPNLLAGGSSGLLCCCVLVPAFTSSSSVSARWSVSVCES